MEMFHAPKLKKKKKKFHHQQWKLLSPQCSGIYSNRSLRIMRWRIWQSAVLITLKCCMTSWNWHVRVNSKVFFCWCSHTTIFKHAVIRNWMFFISISFTTTCFGPYGPSSGGIYTSHFLGAMYVMQNTVLLLFYIFIINEIKMKMNPK
jgi:hypothetical protein